VSTVHRTLPAALADAARDGVGYTFLNDRGATIRSYAEMFSAAGRVARALVDAGLRRGDTVAIVVADAETFLTTIFGASMAGVVAASMHPPLSVLDRARSIDLIAPALRSACARAVVASRSLVPAFANVRSACPTVSMILAAEDLVAWGGPPPDAPISEDDIALVQFTSGSTSQPRGVAITHRNLSANVNAINGPAGLATTDVDVGVSWLPLSHDMGLVGMAIAPVYASRPVVLMPPQMFVKRPVEWLRAISRYRATVSFAPNFAYDLCVRRLKDRDLDGLDLAAWRVAGCGAEPIHAATLEAFAAKFAPAGFRSTSFLPGYGLAEHVLAATFAPRDRPLRVERIADRSIVSCGTPFPEHELRIVDEAGGVVPEREIGEILLAGPSVMACYYNEPGLTAEKIRDGWLHTGDVGFLSRGELFVCGRASDVIVARGRKYHPQDLEWAIEDLPGIRHGRVVAFGCAVPGAADRIVMVVEASGTVARDDLVVSIRRRVSDSFAVYVDDVGIAASGTIERTTSGKVRRAAVKARFQAGEI
jgi:fatty-acyl-CoA synthase